MKAHPKNIFSLMLAIPIILLPVVLLSLITGAGCGLSYGYYFAKKENKNVELKPFSGMKQEVTEEERKIYTRMNQSLTSIHEKLVEVLAVLKTENHHSSHTSPGMPLSPSASRIATFEE